MRETVDHHELLATRGGLKAKIIVSRENLSAWFADTSPGNLPQQVAVIGKVRGFRHEVDTIENGLFGVGYERGNRCGIRIIEECGVKLAKRQQLFDVLAEIDSISDEPDDTVHTGRCDRRSHGIS